MSVESGSSNEQASQWQEPVVEGEKPEDDLRVLGRVGEYLQKIPGGKYILPAVTMLSMLVADTEAQSDAREYLRYERGVAMMAPLVIANEFEAGVKKTPDGNYQIDDKEKLPQRNTLIGDLIYQSSQELKLPADPKQLMQAKIMAYKSELTKSCPDKKLVSDLSAEIDGLAKETFPEGYNQEGQITVSRFNNQTSQLETKQIPVQWATFQEVETEVDEHMGKYYNQIYSSTTGKVRAKVTGLVLESNSFIIRNAAIFNMARSQKQEMANNQK